MVELTEETRKEVEEFGKLGFPMSKVAEWLRCDRRELMEQFRRRDGEVYDAYHRGRLEGLMSLRRTLMKQAEGNNRESMGTMLAFFAQSENENMEIWEE